MLCVPDKNRHVGFLLAARGSAIMTREELAVGTALPVMVEYEPEDGCVRFLHPMNPRWRMGLATERGRSDGAMIFAHRDPHIECSFALEKTELEKLPLAIEQASRDIARHIAVPARHELILEAIRGGTLLRDIAGALLNCLPFDELEALAIKLLDDDDLRDLIGSCVTGDQWISKRLGVLVNWQRDRDGHRYCSGRLLMRETSDIPGPRGFLAHRPKLGLTLTALARRHIQPRKMACVLGSARNEGPYLLDWIAHHKAVGFDHIFIYTNDNTDGSDEMLDILARAGIVTWLANEIGQNTLPQFRSYAHALSALPQILDYRWTLVADLDEYFAFDVAKFASVSDYLIWQERRHAEAIALPWLIYVSAKEDVWRDAPCPERFLCRERNVNHHVKSIFRSNLHWSSTCHNPMPMLELKTNYKAQDGTPHIAKPPEGNIALAHNPQATHAWIAHYIFKSAPEAMMKMARGRGDSAGGQRHAEMTRFMKPFVTLCIKSDLVQDRRTLQCAQGAAQELSRLRDIRGVYDCERRIKDRFLGRMSDLRAQFIREGRVEGEAEECSIFRAMLQEQSFGALFSGADA
jgi:hypothetical protein